MTGVKTCSALGTRIAYRLVASSEGNGVPTVILGGAFANVFSFQLVERVLAQLGPVLLVDLPGNGLSGDSPPGYSQGDALSALIVVFDALGIERVNLIGICNGGPVAHAFAATRPEAVSNLILGSTVLEPCDRHQRILRLICDNLQDGNVSGMAENVLIMLMGEETRPEVLNGPATRNLLRRTLCETSPSNMRRMGRSLQASLEPWPFRSAHISGVRSAAYTGEFDPYTTVADCLTASLTIDGCPMYSFRATDHMVHIERPRELAEFYAKFLRHESLARTEFIVPVGLDAAATAQLSI